MPSRDIIATLRDIMADVFDVDDIAVNENTTAEDIEEWDSLSHIRLMVAIERRFAFKFKNSEIESLKNIGDLVKIIESKVH